MTEKYIVFKINNVCTPECRFAKRITVGHGDVRWCCIIQDEDTIYNFDNSCSAKGDDFETNELLEIVNELHEENERLKKQLSHLEYRFTEYRIKLGERE